jgi:hypothetical protein
MYVSREPKRFAYQGPDTVVRLMLMSDLHIGSSGVDYDRLEKDLRLAREFEARILLNGDVLDLILPGDRKRFDPRGVHESLRGKANVTNGQIELALKILSPYADLIDIVGVGNHETALEKYHSVDPTQILVHQLHQAGSTCAYGGYEGWYRVQIRANDRKVWSWNLRYHHGMGGAAPVTKGMIDFARFGLWVEGADCLWVGHKHNRFIDWARREFCTSQGSVQHRDVLHVMSGSYYPGRSGQSSEDAMQNGRKGGWAHDSGFSPQAMGGHMIELQPLPRKGLSPINVRVVSSS